MGNKVGNKSLKYVLIFQKETHLWEPAFREIVVLGNCRSGKLSSGNLTFLETIDLGNFVNNPLGKLSSGKLSLGNFLLGKFLWRKLSSGKLPLGNFITSEREPFYLYYIWIHKCIFKGALLFHPKRHVRHRRGEQREPECK